LGGWLAGEIKNRFQNTNFLCRFFISLCDNSIARNIDSTGYRAANNFALFSFTARKCVFFAQANCNYLGYEKCSFYDLLMQAYAMYLQFAMPAVLHSANARWDFRKEFCNILPPDCGKKCKVHKKEGCAQRKAHPV